MLLGLLAIGCAEPLSDLARCGWLPLASAAHAGSTGTLVVRDIEQGAPAGDRHDDANAPRSREQPAAPRGVSQPPCACVSAVPVSALRELASAAIANASTGAARRRQHVAAQSRVRAAPAPSPRAHRLKPAHGFVLVVVATRDECARTQPAAARHGRLPRPTRESRSLSPVPPGCTVLAAAVNRSTRQSGAALAHRADAAAAALRPR